MKSRLMVIAQRSGLSQRKFSVAVGQSESWLKTFSGNMGVDVLRNILTTFPEYSSDWILFGNEPMLKADSDDEVKKNTIIRELKNSLKQANEDKALLEAENKKLREENLKQMEINSNLFMQLTQQQIINQNT